MSATQQRHEVLRHTIDIETSARRRPGLPAGRLRDGRSRAVLGGRQSHVFLALASRRGGLLSLTRIEGVDRRLERRRVFGNLAQHRDLLLHRLGEEIAVARQPMLMLEVPKGRPSRAAPLAVDLAFVIAELREAALCAGDRRHLLGRRRFGGAGSGARDLRLRARLLDLRPRARLLLMQRGWGNLLRLSSPTLGPAASLSGFCEGS